MTEPLDSSAPNFFSSRRLDVLLAFLIVVIAFLTASFRARNSDFWLHLATGRLLAQGQQTFGTDPFAYTTEGTYWTNHAWLFDLGLYFGYRWFGGAGLVVLKALGVAVLAGCMLRLGQPRLERAGPFWIGAGCVLLAVLAMSPRLLLQPACLSLLLLIVCLGLLLRGGRALYALPAVIALWVNLDAWFLLGPFVVALFWLGQWRSPADLGPRLPVWLLPACAAACLFSPHHIHALTLPDELSPAVWQSPFRHDVRFAHLFASPWHLASLGPTGGVHLSVWALFLLLLLGPLSFALHPPSLRTWRLPVWLAFAALGAWQVRLVPFFAVVAGPITALNLREVIPQRFLARTGPVAMLLGSLLILTFAYPGWLQGFHRRDRAVAWEVEIDPSLRHVAETLADWRKDSTLPSDTRSFALHPDVAHYCAWFCPEEKCFLDARLQLFLGVADDYQRLCQALLGPLSASRSEPTEMQPEEIARFLDDKAIARLVVSDPDRHRLESCLRRMESLPEWSLLHVDGQALVVGCSGSSPFPRTEPRFDADVLAFAAGVHKALPPAPIAGPAVLTRPRPWWESVLERPSGSTWEAEAGSVFLRLFEVRESRESIEQQRVVLARYATMLLAAKPLAVAAQLALSAVFIPDLRERSPALPLLGARAARRAIAAHPDDAKAWLVLAQSYLSLGRTTTEATDDAMLPPLAQIRYIQTVTALVQVVNIRPDLASAHEYLARLFAERGYFDLSSMHREIELRLTRQAGRQPGEDATTFANRIERLEQAVEQMRSTVQDSENRFLVRSEGLSADPLARARLALQLNLAGKALDEVLLRSSADLYGVEGIRLLLELLLLTGRVQEARELLDRDELLRNPEGLGSYELRTANSDRRGYGYRFTAYDWFDLCQAAGAGNYDRANSALFRLRGRMRILGKQLAERLERPLLWHAGAELGLGASPQSVFMRLHMRQERERVGSLLVQSQFLQLVRADLLVLEGMLLLERGVPGEADTTFRRSLELYRLGEDIAPVLPGKLLAIRYRQRLRPFAP